MRKIVLALFLALTVVATGLNQASAMEGFDLGEMPPLPPPLLDNDSTGAAPLTPPPSGAMSPLMQSSTTSSAGLSPVTAPPVGGGAGFATNQDTFSTPAPPPLAPPPVAPPITPEQTPGALQAGFGAPSLSTQPQVQMVAANETPQPGKVTGGRVNVRAGPNTQYESVAVLTTGAPVTVLAKHGDWYKIVFPADQLASIHKNYVTADITGEIPETGLPGTVSQDNADVHAFYWDKSTVVGKMNKGDPVTIKQERGQWYRIDAPASARAYVFAQYVRVEGGGPVVADAAPAPTNESVDLSVSGDGKKGETKLSQRDKDLIAIKESFYARQRERIEAEREEEERAMQEAIAAKKRQSEQLDLALKDLDSRLAAIDKETTERMSYFSNVNAPTTLTTLGSAAWAPQDPASGGYTGWIENIGRVGSAPSAYRLTKGGEIRFYLRSGVYNLDEYTNRRIWVNGQIEPASGASASVLNVDQIRILTELEIAEGMKQSPGYVDSPAANPNPYYDNSSYNDTYYGGTTYGGTTTTYDSSSYTSGGTTYSYGTTTTYGTPVGGTGVTTYYGGESSGTADMVVPAPMYGATTSTTTYGDPFATSYPGATVVDSTTTTTYTTTYGSTPGASVYTSQPTYGQPAPTAPAAPAQPGLTPSDPSQLPDVVGAGMSNPYSSGGGIPTFGMGNNMGTSMGEVDTDYYEKPVISDIAP